MVGVGDLGLTFLHLPLPSLCTTRPSSFLLLIAFFFFFHSNKKKSKKWELLCSLSTRAVAVCQVS